MVEVLKSRAHVGPEISGSDQSVAFGLLGVVCSGEDGGSRKGFERAFFDEFGDDAAGAVEEVFGVDVAEEHDLGTDAEDG